MAIALDASTPAAVWNDTAGTSSLTTASFTPPVGSLVVAKATNADASQTIGTPSGFTSRVDVGTSGTNSRAAIFTADGAGVPGTVTVTFAVTSQERGLVVEVFTGAQLEATPATDSLISAGTIAPSDTITTTGTDSVVTWVTSDFNAADGTSRTYRSSATETAYHRSAGFGAYQAYQAAAVAGSQTYGLTAPATQKPTMASLEIQVGTAGDGYTFVHLLSPVVVYPLG